MNTVLLTAGVVCLIAAVLGGGLKAFNFDVPVISSLRRQALLFVIGAVFVGMAWVLRDRSGPGSDDGAAAYRQVAVATCARIVKIRTADPPFGMIDITPGGVRVHKASLVREVTKRQTAIQAELETLWGHDPPKQLSAEQDRAEELSRVWLEKSRKAIRALEASAPDPMTEEDADKFYQAVDVGLRARLNDAMTSLAGQDCPVAA